MLGRKTLQFRVEKMMFSRFRQGRRAVTGKDRDARFPVAHGHGAAAGGPAFVAGLCPGRPGQRHAAARLRYRPEALRPSGACLPLGAGNE